MEPLSGPLSAGEALPAFSGEADEDDPRADDDERLARWDVTAEGTAEVTAEAYSDALAESPAPSVAGGWAPGGGGGALLRLCRHCGRRRANILHAWPHR